MIVILFIEPFPPILNPKFLGMFSSVHLHSDWQVAMPNEKAGTTTTWKDFVDAMKEYYKPTQNPTLKNSKLTHSVTKLKKKHNTATSNANIMNAMQMK